MLKFIILAWFLMALVATNTWKDCGDPASRVVTINKFEYPSHIIFPSQVHFSLDMTFKSNISQVYIDFEVIRYFLGFPLKLPCNLGTIIGSCKGRDMCYLLNLTLGYNQTNYYGYKFQSIMKNVLNDTLHCPIKPGNLSITNELFELEEIPDYLHLLADGKYTIRIKAYKDMNTTTSDIGCIEVNVTIGGLDGTAGSLFG